ncbi:MAG: alpha/beta hydrolase [Hyphomicrobiales bacterium]|nr:alpha/beta hydrolase [Hyphomicrobiales bacterium]MCY4049639.1 alpha/beta hydrolase [Hyphomicrobiales bacterium]MCY4052775.1 alpha/beta hydrolase [Hyphomicrobiales bacterium]
MTDRDFWDSQYRFSRIIPGFEDALRTMASQSADFAENVRLIRSEYGTHSRQWVEWTGGTGPEDVLPVVLHGGYWRALEAETHRFLMRPLRPHGAVVANVEYRLMPDIRLADVVADAKAALHHLAAEFPEAQLLPVGHSAGAHLALCAMADSSLATRTRGIIALSGVYDLAPVARSFLQDEIHLTTQEIKEFSLEAGIPRPPVIYVNGSEETHEFLRGGALMSGGSKAVWHRIAGADHMSITWMAAAEMTMLVSKILVTESPSG